MLIFGGYVFFQWSSLNLKKYINKIQKLTIKKKINKNTSQKKKNLQILMNAFHPASNLGGKKNKLRTTKMTKNLFIGHQHLDRRKKIDIF